MSRGVAALRGAASALRSSWSVARHAVGAVRRSAPRQRLAAAVARYERFTGVDELRELHKGVAATQEKFVEAQDARRACGERLLEHQAKLRTVREEMKSASRGDPSYLKLITEEHNLIVSEDELRNEFVELEKREREFFTEMTAAVKLSHETERFYAEKNKYLYIVASIVGTALGILGTTVNNRLKMAEFKEMILQESSGSKIWSLNFTEGPIQTKLGELESRVIAVSTNQKTILDYIVDTDKKFEREFANITKLLTKQEKENALSNAFKKLATAKSRAEEIVNPEETTVNPRQIGTYTFFAAAGLVGAWLVSKIIS